MKFSILAIVFLYGANATPSEEGASIRGGRQATERSCEPCSYEVCSSDLNACPTTNPFLCLDGKAVGGCTAIADIWLNPEDCHECCDLSSCDAPRAPTCEPCSHEVCTSDLNACPETNPYLCLDGKAVGGCTAIADIWLNPEDCHECCDLSSCDAPRAPTCEPCSHEVCASDLNACPTTDPYLCLDGKAVGGCTAIADIWLNPEDCHNCCDLSHCPSPKVEEPKEDEPTGDLHLYVDASGDTIFFNLDEHCHPDEFCVGTVIPFKNDVYYDKYLTQKAGHNYGNCIVVAEHDVFYCVFSVVIKHEGEIALQGYGTLGPDGSTFLITAGSGTYKGAEGTLYSTPTDDANTKYKYSFTFH